MQLHNSKIEEDKKLNNLRPGDEMMRLNNHYKFSLDTGRTEMAEKYKETMIGYFLSIAETMSPRFVKNWNERLDLIPLVLISEDQENIKLFDYLEELNMLRSENENFLKYLDSTREKVMPPIIQGNEYNKQVELNIWFAKYLEEKNMSNEEISSIAYGSTLSDANEVAKRVSHNSEVLDKI